MTNQPLRVIQCGTGLAGTQALGSIIERDRFDLVGLLVHSESNEGRDAGDFTGQGETGITGVRDASKLTSLDADAVIYMMLVPSLDDICAFLASGKNVVTTAGFMYPKWNQPDAYKRLQTACEKGRTSFHVTGINPGFVDEVLPLTLSSLSREWTKVQINEYADCSTYPSAPMLFDVMGFGRTPKEIADGKVADMSVMTTFFAASVAGLAHGLGVELDTVEESRDFILADAAFDIDCGRIEKDTIAGQRWRWVGKAGGLERIVQQTFWFVKYDLGADFPRSEQKIAGGARWEVTIEGTPSQRCTYETAATFLSEPAGENVANPSAISTGVAAVNCLPALIAATPGIKLAPDLPQPRIRA